MSIKYYQLAKDEKLPDEFCVVRDVGGEPSEYTFYVPEAKKAKTNKVISEILFNRGLIWVMLAYLRTLHEDTNSELMQFMFLALAAYNFYKSWKTFGTEE